MTQPPYPPRPDQPVPPGWAQDPHGAGQRAPGYDPSRPLGAPRPDSTSINEFAPPRSKAPWIIGLGAVLVAILIAVTATLQTSSLFGNPPAPASPTPTPTPTPPPPGQPFTTDDGHVQGRWEVVEHRWDEEGLQVKVRVAVDRGTLRFSFLAFSNDAAEVVYPSPGADYPSFGSLPIGSGEERDGWLFFPIYQADLTLILTTDAGRQISALVVPA